MTKRLAISGKQVLLGSRLVIVLCNEHNLLNSDAGFSERARQAFAPGR